MTIQELEAVAAFCAEYIQYLEKGILGRVLSLGQSHNHEVKNVLLRLQGACQAPGCTLQHVTQDIANEMEAMNEKITATYLAQDSEWKAYLSTPQPQFKVPPTDLAQEPAIYEQRIVALQVTIAELRKTNAELVPRIEALHTTTSQLRKTNAELFAKWQNSLNNPPAREVVQQYEEARASWRAQRALFQSECAELREDNTKLRAALGVLVRTPFGQGHETDCECSTCQQATLEYQAAYAAQQAYAASSDPEE